MSVSGYKDDFGDRIKQYEAVETARTLDPRLPIYVRIDGRSFSSFTSGMRRPYDERMSSCMAETTKALVRATHARIGFTQSDEISLVYLYDAPESEPLFGGKVHKLTSVLASLAASAFQVQIAKHTWTDMSVGHLGARLPHFDARAFSLPSKTEAANAVLWRAMDAKKNAISMAARAHYSAKALHLKDQTAMLEMLADKGINFEAYPIFFTRGAFVRRVATARNLSPQERLAIPERHRPSPETLVVRSDVITVSMPEFRKVANREAVIFDGADPSLKPDDLPSCRPTSM